MLEPDISNVQKQNDPIHTISLLFENGRPITLIAPLTIISLYYFVFIPKYTVQSIINFILLLLGVICLRTGINNVNNSYDVDADRINKPHRPIPRGELPLESAFIIGTILQFISLFIFMLLSIEAFLLDLSFVVLAWLYNIDRGLKNIFPLNNLVIGYVRGFGYLLAPLSLGYPILFPQLSMHDPPLEPLDPVFIIFAMCVMMYIFGSVNSKDIKDVEGDIETNRVTLPILLGNKNKYLALISAPFILTPIIVFVSLSFLNYLPDTFYLILVLLPLDLSIIYFMNRASTTKLTENTTAWLMMIITYLSHHIVFLTILVIEF